MRYLGHGNLIALIKNDVASAAESSPTSPKAVPAGAYNRSNEDLLRASTGVSFKSLFNKIVRQNSSHLPPSPPPNAARAMMQRAGSLSTPSPRRRPSINADETPRSQSHILISFPIPEHIGSAVIELWARRLEAEGLWYLNDEIDFDSPNEEALFTVVRLALIDRVRDGQLSQPERPAPDATGEVALFSDPSMHMPLLKAVAIARMLTDGDPEEVALLHDVLRRRVANADYPVQTQDVPRDANLERWQQATSAILGKVYEADGALRDSDLNEALQHAWLQVHELAD